MNTYPKDGMKTYREVLDEMEVDPNYKNPFHHEFQSYTRRQQHKAVFDAIQGQIEKMTYPMFISYPEDAEFIEAVVQITMAKRILELGMYTGFTTLHMIRGVYPDGMVVAVDNQKVFPSFFNRPDIQQCFRFIHDDTTRLQPLHGEAPFDLVYIDSSHTMEHTENERLAAWPLTRKGTVFMYHDCGPSGPLNAYLYRLVNDGVYKGLILPSAHRMDLGPGYVRDQLPHMGLFIRQ